MSMGRTNSPITDFSSARKLSCRRVRINAQGYECGATWCYWGEPSAPLFCISDPGTGAEWYVRAANRAAAMASFKLAFGTFCASAWNQFVRSQSEVELAPLVAPEFAK